MLSAVGSAQSNASKIQTPFQSFNKALYAHDQSLLSWGPSRSQMQHKVYINSEKLQDSSMPMEYRLNNPS